MQDIKTIRDVLRYTESRFNEAGLTYTSNNTENAWKDAIALVMPSLHLQFHHPIEEILDACLTVKEREKIFALVERRVNERIPTSYLTHQAWFARRSFYVDERVLVPRSPFDDLIENNFQPYVTNPPRRILDLCTGSGCIAIACAYAFPDAQVDAVDLSKGALEVANKNIALHVLTSRVKTYHSDCFDGLPKSNKYDLIVSNPPYVAPSEINYDAHHEINHEPEMALISGDHGLDLITRILQNAREHLNDDGILMIESGWGVAKEILLRKYPTVAFTWAKFKRYQNNMPSIFVLEAKQLDEYRTLFNAN